MARKSFSIQFTRMWWPSSMSLHQVQHTGDQLCVHAHMSWQRTVCDNWLGNPIASTDHVFQIAGELRRMGYKHFFISRRGTQDATYGIQVWSAEPEMQFVIMLHAAPVVSMRSYTPDQFEDQIRTMLSWRH